jgi:hypothetical protein
MRELFRDYGAAIGPTVAFALGVFALVVKHGFDNLAARRSAERRVAKIAEMVQQSQPPVFYPPISPSTTLTNMANMSLFFDRMAVIQVAFEAPRCRRWIA